jgi:hypothetical protein
VIAPIDDAIASATPVITVGTRLSTASLMLSVAVATSVARRRLRVDDPNVRSSPRRCLGHIGGCSDKPPPRIEQLQAAHASP